MGVVSLPKNEDPLSASNKLFPWLFPNIFFGSILSLLVFTLFPYISKSFPLEKNGLELFLLLSSKLLKFDLFDSSFFKKRSPNKDFFGLWDSSFAWVWLGFLSTLLNKDWKGEEDFWPSFSLSLSFSSFMIFSGDKFEFNTFDIWIWFISSGFSFSLLSDKFIWIWISSSSFFGNFSLFSFDNSSGLLLLIISSFFSSFSLLALKLEPKSELGLGK